MLVHANGDAAIDQFIGAVKDATAKQGKADRRSVLIHSQTIRDDQLDQLKALDIIPSFFSLHTYYWGGLASPTNTRRDASSTYFPDSNCTKEKFNLYRTP